MRAALNEHPDVCLLDVNMPGNGIAAAARIHAALPDTAVVMLTVSKDNNDLFDALRAGPLAICSRTPTLLASPTPSAACSKERPRSRGPGRTADRRVPRPRAAARLSPKRRSVELTSREWQVLELLRAGLTTGEIADQLVISRVTVRTHVSAILKKLQVGNRKAALQLFEEN